MLPSDCSVWHVCWFVRSRAQVQLFLILFMLMTKLSGLLAFLDWAVLTLCA